MYRKQQWLCKLHRWQIVFWIVLSYKWAQGCRAQNIVPGFCLFGILKYKQKASLAYWNRDKRLQSSKAHTELYTWNIGPKAILQNQTWVLEFNIKMIGCCSLQNERKLTENFVHHYINHYFEILPSIVERRYWWPCMIRTSLPWDKKY